MLEKGYINVTMIYNVIKRVSGLYINSLLFQGSFNHYVNAAIFVVAILAGPDYHCDEMY